MLRIGEVFGIDPKRGMPFFGLLKREIFGKISAGELKKELFKRRNEIAQKLIELAYHIYGEKNHGN